MKQEIFEKYGVKNNIRNWLQLNSEWLRDQRIDRNDLAPFPAIELMQRTTCTTSEQIFADHGVAVFRDLNRAVPIPSAGANILDFGCGAGRLARIFYGSDNHYFGCDIDPQCVSWVQDNLKFMKVDLLKFNQPMPYPDNFFDYVYGVSVFTHLDEVTSDFYLRELHRISKPGANLLLTVHGYQALTLAEHKPEIRIDMGINEQNLEGIKRRFFEGEHIYIEYTADLLGLKQSYGITFTNENYIKSHWSSWFDVKDIYYGGLGNFHDIVVVTPKK